MKLNLKTLLVGAVALTAAGSALANTTIANGGTGDGSLFLNVVDTTAGTSYTLDLSATNAGDHVKEFNGSVAQSFTLTGDANWTSFTSSIGAGDIVNYNVVGDVTLNNQNQFTFTSNTAKGTGASQVGGSTNTQLKNNNMDSFINAVNASANTSTTSLFVTSTGANANTPAYFGSAFVTAGGLPATTDAVGTALAFYNIAINPANNNSNLNKALVTTYAGTWDLTNLTTLSYNVSAVPLPMPLTLLLSGLALMGIIARRGKSQSADLAFSGAAA
jgi:hypothetical protein